MNASSLYIPTTADEKFDWWAEINGIPVAVTGCLFDDDTMYFVYKTQPALTDEAKTYLKICFPEIKIEDK